MSDFHQEGNITTLHDLYRAFGYEEYLINLENKLEEYSQSINISLLLPCLFTELKNPDVINRIIKEIKKVKYIKNIVVALGGAPNEDQFEEAKDYFANLNTKKRNLKIIWVEGPRVQQVFKKIEDREIRVGTKGKGQSVWIALGYLFGENESDIIALHDCDIVTYDRILLGRLIEPTANPNNDYEFCKGFYSRISLKDHVMRGRVTRLFVTPFVDSMMNIMLERKDIEMARFFAYHRTYKYPLAGEFSFTSQLAKGIGIAYDWGLEVSTLSEVYHRVIQKKIAQVDLTPNYEHKHQDLSPDDANKGLHRMVVDIATFYLHYMRAHGVPLDDSFVDMMLHTYYNNALKFIKCYSYDAEVNQLKFDRYQEELMAHHFRGYLWTAWENSKGPHEPPTIPSWNRVLYSIPDIYSDLICAVEKDNQ